MTKKAIHTSKMPCPSCDSKLDAAVGITSDVGVDESAKPEVGNYSICGYCHALLQFAEGGFHWVTLREFGDLDEDYRDFLARSVMTMSVTDGSPPVLLLAKPWEGPVH